MSLIIISVIIVRVVAARPTPDSRRSRARDDHDVVASYFIYLTEREYLFRSKLIVQRKEKGTKL